MRPFVPFLSNTPFPERANYFPNSNFTQRSSAVFTLAQTHICYGGDLYYIHETASYVDYKHYLVIFYRIFDRFNLKNSLRKNLNVYFNVFFKIKLRPIGLRSQQRQSKSSDVWSSGTFCVLIIF